MNGNNEKSLLIIENVDSQVPHHNEALFVKAQILKFSKLQEFVSSLKLWYVIPLIL
jgi:hypothetical protein